MPFTHLHIDGPVATLILDHPGGNRINFAMRIELREAMEQIEQSSARAMLIVGEGSDFCLGGDVRDWPGIPVEDLRPKIEVFAEALGHLRRLPIPTVAAVQGGCMGGGFELVLACDLIVAASGAWFSFPEARLGILTLQGGMLDIAARVGRAKAAEMVFLSEPVPAERLLGWNVVNQIVDAAELRRRAIALAKRLASGLTQAFAATKALWQLQAESGTEAARRGLYDLSMPLFDTNDARKALRAAADAVNAGMPFPAARFSGH